MKVQDKKGHGNSEDPVAQGREAFHALAGDPIVREHHAGISCKKTADNGKILFIKEKLQ